MKTFLVLSAIFVATFATFRDDINLKTIEHADLILKGLKSGAPIPKVSIQGRIFGGNIAEPHQFPYQVGLLLVSPSEEFGGNPETSWCGGSLISREFVLTAGHCAYGVYKAAVILGAHNILTQEADRQVVDVGKDNIFVHPLYDPKIAFNDVALIRLPVPVELSDIVHTIKLPRPSMVQSQLEGHILLVTGWGQLGNSGNVAEELRYANRRILPQRTCAIAFPHIFHKTQICVSGDVQSVCPGDSGGPLVAQESDGADVVVGIASFIRNEGCEVGLPTVFTRVTSYLDWITRMTGIEVRN